MKIDDVFFAIGLIIISSLLVFVVYDDITAIQDHINMEDLEEVEENASNTLDRFENESLVLPNVNDTSGTVLSQKTKTTSTQTSDTTKVTQKSNTESGSNLKSDMSKDNPNNNVKTHTEEFKTSNFQNTYNNMVNRQSGHANNRM